MHWLTVVLMMRDCIITIVMSLSLGCLLQCAVVIGVFCTWTPWHGDCTRPCNELEGHLEPGATWMRRCGGTTGQFGPSGPCTCGQTERKRITERTPCGYSKVCTLTTKIFKNVTSSTCRDAEQPRLKKCRHRYLYIGQWTEWEQIDRNIFYSECKMFSWLLGSDAFKKIKYVYPRIEEKIACPAGNLSENPLEQRTDYLLAIRRTERFFTSIQGLTDAIRSKTGWFLMKPAFLHIGPVPGLFANPFWPNPLEMKSTDDRIIGGYKPWKCERQGRQRGAAEYANAFIANEYWWFSEREITVFHDSPYYTHPLCKNTVTWGLQQGRNELYVKPLVELFKTTNVTMGVGRLRSTFEYKFPDTGHGWLTNFKGRGIKATCYDSDQGYQNKLHKAILRVRSSSRCDPDDSEHRAGPWRQWSTLCVGSQESREPIKRTRRRGKYTDVQYKRDCIHRDYVKKAPVSESTYVSDWEPWSTSGLCPAGECVRGTRVVRRLCEEGKQCQRRFTQRDIERLSSVHNTTAKSNRDFKEVECPQVSKLCKVSAYKTLEERLKAVRRNFNVPLWAPWSSWTCDQTCGPGGHGFRRRDCIPSTDSVNCTYLRGRAYEVTIGCNSHFDCGVTASGKRSDLEKTIYSEPDEIDRDIRHFLAERHDNYKGLTAGESFDYTCENREAAYKLNLEAMLLRFPVRWIWRHNSKVLKAQKGRVSFQEKFLEITSLQPEDSGVYVLTMELTHYKMHTMCLFSLTVTPPIDSVQVKPLFGSTEEVDSVDLHCNQGWLIQMYGRRVSERPIEIIWTLNGSIYRGVHADRINNPDALTLNYISLPPNSWSLSGLWECKVRTPLNETEFLEWDTAAVRIKYRTPVTVADKFRTGKKVIKVFLILLSIVIPILCLAFPFSQPVIKALNWIVAKYHEVRENMKEKKAKRRAI